MRSLFFGILFIILVGVGGAVYRTVMERPATPIVCPLDALVCPDGTGVGRTGSTCTFPACPFPNTTLPQLGISFAIPEGFFEGTESGYSAVAAYTSSTTNLDSLPNVILVRQFPIAASSTALATIQATAIGDPSGLPLSPTRFRSTTLGNYRFTVVGIERNEGQVTVAYYLAREKDVLRFDAIDRGVTNWMDPTLNEEALPAQQALMKLLTTLQGQHTAE